ncbi:MAG: hypothetical protein ACREQ7_24545 [Candidatus Binatia bacterium]
MTKAKNLCRKTVTVFISFSLLVNLIIPVPVWTAEQTPPFNPPWNQTQERIPQEVKDKEKEQPIAWCEDPAKKQFEAHYIDFNNGTRTRIRRKEVPSAADPTKTKIVWEIQVRNGVPKTKTTYDLDPGKETRTERVDKNPPSRRPVAEGDLFDPKKQAPARGGSLRLPFFSNRLAKIADRAPDPSTSLFRENSSINSFRLVLAGTTDTRPTATTQTREGNVKLVSYGKPPENTVFFQEEAPPTNPEDFVADTTGGTPTTPPNNWGPTDSEGPTFTSGPTKTPFTSHAGDGILVGWGWASGRIPAVVVISCAHGDDDDDDVDLKLRKEWTVNWTPVY